MRNPGSALVLSLAVLVTLAGCSENPVAPEETVVAPFAAQISGDVNLSMTGEGQRYDYTATATDQELELTLYALTEDQSVRDERSSVHIEIPFRIQDDLGEGVRYTFDAAAGDAFRGDLTYSLKNPGKGSRINARYRGQTLTIGLNRPQMPNGAKNRLIGHFTLVGSNVMQERVLNGNVISEGPTGGEVRISGQFDVKIYQRH